MDFGTLVVGRTVFDKCSVDMWVADKQIVDRFEVVVVADMIGVDTLVVETNQFADNLMSADSQTVDMVEVDRFVVDYIAVAEVVTV